MWGGGLGMSGNIYFIFWSQVCLGFFVLLQGYAWGKEDLKILVHCPKIS